MKVKTELTKENIISILNENRKTLEKYKVKKIGLFGSYLRNEQRRNSDIDLLVEFEKSTFDNYMDLSFYLEDLFDEKVQLITLNALSPYMKPFIEKEVEWIEEQ